MSLGSILLALAWAALQGEVTLANLLTGYIVGYAILALLAKGGVMPSTLASRTAHAAGLAAFLAWALLIANFRVAADVLRGHQIEPAVVAIPLDITTDGEILLLSMLINITPGSVTIDLSDDRRTLYVHVMHMTSAEASRREIKEGFERRVKLVFGQERWRGDAKEDRCSRT
jgi:multicomponent Na+:H+ antiporter subunit E